MSTEKKTEPQLEITHGLGDSVDLHPFEVSGGKHFQFLSWNPESENKMLFMSNSGHLSVIVFDNEADKPKMCEFGRWQDKLKIQEVWSEKEKDLMFKTQTRPTDDANLLWTAFHGTSFMDFILGKQNFDVNGVLNNDELANGICLHRLINEYGLGYKDPWNVVFDEYVDSCKKPTDDPKKLMIRGLINYHMSN